MYDILNLFKLDLMALVGMLFIAVEVAITRRTRTSHNAGGC